MQEICLSSRLPELLVSPIISGRSPWSVCQIGLLVRNMSVIMRIIYALFTIKRIVALGTFTVTKLIMCIARSGQIAISLLKIEELFKQVRYLKRAKHLKKRKQASKQSSQKYLRHLGTSRDTDVPNQMNGGRINNNYWKDVFGTMYVPIHNVPSSKAGGGTCCCATLIPSTVQMSLLTGSC